jgi:hypothetical protein
LINAGHAYTDHLTGLVRYKANPSYLKYNIFGTFLVIVVIINTNLNKPIANLIFFDKARPARKADNLTAIFEPIVKVMWDP